MPSRSRDEQYFIRTLLEDLDYLKREWTPKVTDAALRRGSPVLRRLLVNDDFLKAWHLLRVGHKPHVKAPRAEYFLEHPEADRIEILISGGGHYAGAFAALAMVNTGRIPIPLSRDINPIEYRFTLGEFLQSTGIYMSGLCVSRREVVQYVANKLGGAHLDFKRSGKLKEKFETLDRGADRLQIEGVPKPAGKNAVYFELLSIGQLFAQSPAATELRATV